MPPTEVLDALYDKLDELREIAEDALDEKLESYMKPGERVRFEFEEQEERNDEAELYIGTKLAKELEIEPGDYKLVGKVVMKLKGDGKVFYDPEESPSTDIIGYTGYEVIARYKLVRG